MSIPWIICVFIFLSAAFYILIKTLCEVSNRNKMLEDENYDLRENVAYLVAHTEQITKIQSQTEKRKEEIQNAKTDEEVLSIINGIIADNNNWVRKHKE